MAFTYTVASACGPLPTFHSTVEPLTKFVPVMPICSSPLPAVAVFGVRPDAPIPGCPGTAAAVTVNVSRFDVERSGFSTPITTEPAVAMRLAGTSAVNWVALTNTVASDD